MPVTVGDDAAKLWQNFVEAGGTLLVTAPAGYRTEHNTWLMRPPPGPLTELLGVEVTEHDALSGAAGNTVDFGGAALPARAFCSLVELRGAESVAFYGEDYYKGRPAVTRRADGNGHAFFLGALGGNELYERVLELACGQAGLERNPWSSDAVEVIPLKAGESGGPLAFVLNHSGQSVNLSLPAGRRCRDLLAGRDHTETVPLPGYGVALLEG